jgi:glycosyltransferase involved in cell wall biosynthesis
MSCGCAVISTQPHAVEALEHHAGILLKEFNNPEEFKSAILRLIENKERVAMGKMLFLVTWTYMGKYCHQIWANVW